MSVPQMIGRLLTTLVRLKGCESALEIGTFVGYSGICIARGLSHTGRLTTLEERELHANLARRHFNLAGVADKIDVVIGHAADSLKRMCEEERQFDFFFIDADKTSYPEYLIWATRLAKKGAILVADNVLAKGRAADFDNHNPTPVAIRRFNECLLHHEQWQATLLPAYDGIAIAEFSG